MRILRIYLFLLCIVPGYSQSLIFDKIGKKDGLPDNDILSMVQDNYGHLWFGGSNGLSLYNGYSFRTWRHEQGDSTSLPDNQIEILTATPEHSLLVGFINLGIYKFDYQKELFVPLDKSQKNPHKKWLSAYYAKSGKIYIGSSDGLEWYDEAHEKLIRINLKIDFPLFISSISEDEAGRLWLMCNSNKIARYNPSTNVTDVIQYGDNKKGLMNRGGRIAYSNDGSVWIGTEYEGLYIYTIQNKTFRHFCKDEKNLTSNIVLCFLEDKNGKMWVGTDNGGLYCFKSSADIQPQHYSFDVRSENSISSNTIYAIIPVEPNLMLIGTYAGGLNIINNFRHKFTTLSDQGPPGTVLNQRSVLSFAKAKNNKIWVGTDGGGLNLYDPQKQTYTYFTTQNKKMPHSSVAKTIYVDSKSRIWVGSYAGGVAVFDSNFKHIKTFSVENSNNRIESDHVWCITEDHQQHIWMGTYNNGVECISSDLSKIDHYNFYYPGHHGLSSSRIFQIMTGKDGKIWTLSETLQYFDPVLNKFTDYLYPGVQLPINLRDMCIDKYGNLWIGSADATFFKVPFDKKEALEIFPSSMGWFGNAALSLQDDDDGDIWIATDVGISCMKQQNRQTSFLNFDIHDGVLPGQFNYGAKMKDNEGYIYFGGTVGYHRFHPRQIILNKHLPKVSISDIRVYNQPLSSLSRYKKSRAVFWNDSTIKFNYNDKMISIEFAGLDFVLPEKNRFAYILEGFDHNWNYSHTGIHMATYTNLDPGNYTFKVKAANNDGKWNNESSKLFLVILPPWWETWWFRLIVLSGLAGLLMGLYFWRTRSIRKRNLELKNEVESQTTELRHINHELANLYSELTESIQAAQVIQNGILPEQELLDEYFGEIKVMYKPKDVVSGDFYWCAKSGNRRMLAVIDCTGHGVAGAFMTFIAYETLNQIVRENAWAEAGHIITLLNQEIINSMNRYKTGKINAGMDVSLCIWNKQSNTLQYAGANNPLYLIRNEQVLVQKGDRQGVGGKQKHATYQFKTNHLLLEKNDQIYLFSDGYADQLGGKMGNEKFMYPRFRDKLLQIRNKKNKDRIDDLEKTFEEWRNGQEQLDDVLVISFDVV